SPRPRLGGDAQRGQGGTPARFFQVGGGCCPSPRHRPRAFRRSVIVEGSVLPPSRAPTGDVSSNGHPRCSFRSRRPDRVFGSTVRASLASPRHARAPAARTAEGERHVGLVGGRARSPARRQAWGNTRNGSLGRRGGAPRALGTSVERGLGSRRKESR